MMKKTYQYPSTEVQDIKTQALMAGSIEIKEGGADNEELLLSRGQRSGFWNDDEE